MLIREIPPLTHRNDACELFRALQAVVRFNTGRNDADPLVSVDAALIFLHQSGLAAQITDHDEEGWEEREEDEGKWMLTVEGNQRLADLLQELKRWCPNSAPGRTPKIHKCWPRRASKLSPKRQQH